MLGVAFKAGTRLDRKGGVDNLTNYVSRASQFYVHAADDAFDRARDTNGLRDDFAMDLGCFADHDPFSADITFEFAVELDFTSSLK